MSTSMHIKSSEHGVVRVFHIDLPKEAVQRFTKQAGTGEWPVQYALGAKSLRASFVEVVDIRDLGDMPLSQYLSKAYDLTGKEFDALRPRVDALKGHVLVLPSQAFDHTEQNLTISAPLRWVVTLNEPKGTPTGAPIISESAKGIVGGQSADEPPVGGPAFWLVVGGFSILVFGIIAAKFLI